MRTCTTRKSSSRVTGEPIAGLLAASSMPNSSDSSSVSESVLRCRVADSYTKGTRDRISFDPIENRKGPSREDAIVVSTITSGGVHQAVLVLVLVRPHHRGTASSPARLGSCGCAYAKCVKCTSG